MLRAAARALLPLLALATASARMMSKAELHAKQAQAAARVRATLPHAPSAGGSGVKNITFKNPRASGKLRPPP